MNKFSNNMRYSFILFFLIFTEITFSQYPIIRNFNRKVSNSGTQNWSITQGKNDWMYFANNDGLLEFDGNNWDIYPIPNYTNIRSVYYDRNTNRIYAGAFDEFGYYQRNNQGKCKYTSLVSKLKGKIKSFSEIWGIEKQNNIIFFHSDNYIFKYENEKVTQYKIKEKIAKIASINNFLFIVTEKDGVFVFNDNMLIPLVNNEILKRKKVCAILPYKNKILFVTEFNGIYQFDNRMISKMPIDLDGFLIENQVFCASIQNNIIAIGTVRNGVVIKNLSTNKNTFLNINSGLQNNTILSVFFDRLGNLWLGLDKGIDFVCYNSSVYDFFGNNNQYGTGYASALKESTLYLGTNQGLYMTKYPILNGENGIQISAVNNIQGQVWSLAIIDNTLFCGSDHGTYIIKGNNAEIINHTTGTWAFKTFPNNPDVILTSSYNGFYLLKKINGSWTFYKHISGFEEHGTNFEIDDKSQIWFSHWLKGIYKINLSQSLDSIVRIELYNEKNGLYSKNNRIVKFNRQLIISSENDFYLYNSSKNKVSKYPFLENLFGTRISSKKLYLAKNNDIWSISNHQIYRAIYNNKYRIDSTGFSVIKGKLVPGFEYINNLDSNNIIIGTENGYSIINLQKDKTINDTVLNIAIRDIHLTNQKDSIVNCNYCLDGKKTPKFKSNENSIRFEFVATEYREEESILYSYKLEGLDEKWSDYSLKETKEYTNLKKGKYTFRVRAKNSYNNLTSEASYTFTILPAWYESFLAKIIYTLLIIFVIYLLIKYLDDRSNQKIMGITELKEQELKEQEEKFLIESEKKETEIINLKNQKLQYELRHKSQDLASSTMNIIRKNEVLQEINKDLEKMGKDILYRKEPDKILENLKNMQLNIKKNFKYDNSWKRFQENFDLVYENYLKRLNEQYPALTVNDKKLCAYLKMNLNSKEIAPLLNMSYRSVEMSRYRLRKKLNLNRETNLTDFLQKF